MLDRLMYGLCWRGDWISDLVSRFWFKWRCPYPIMSDKSARACIRAGYCGCNNAKR